jgi:hypothetical protein
MLNINKDFALVQFQNYRAQNAEDHGNSNSDRNLKHVPPVAATVCEGLSKSFRTCCLERELQMVQLSATRWVSLVSFAAKILCVAS